MRTYLVHGKPWTERTVQYRTATYVVLVRINAYANPEAGFLTSPARPATA
ncbi:MAG TPA: hypothetical protein VGL05_26855 [Kribbella sp.]